MYNRAMASSRRLIILALCGIAIVLREPRLVFQPRLWAEELTIHLHHAFGHGVLQSLFLVPTSEGPAGYLQLPANLAATLAAHFFPLAWAPAVTLSIAFLCQLLPLAVVLRGHSLLWKSEADKVLCCSLILFAPTVHPGVWLSTIHAQIFCGLTAFLLLFEDLERQKDARFGRWALLLCGLSGIYTSLLTLPYLLRARSEKEALARREAWLRAAIVAGCALLQLTLYLIARFSVSIAPVRRSSLGWDSFEVVFFHHLLRPFMGSGAQRLQEHAGALPGMGILCALGLAALLAFLLRKPRRPIPSLFPITFAVLVITVSLLAHGAAIRRYTVLSGWVVVLGALAFSLEAPPRSHRRRFFQILLALSLIAGVAEYREDPIIVLDGERISFFGTLAEGRTNWTEQVAQRGDDPTIPVKAWPYHRLYAWHTYLIPASEFRHLRASLQDFDDVNLIVNNQNAAFTRINLPPLPPSFRVVIRGEVDLGDRRPDLKIHAQLEDAEGKILAARKLKGLRSEGTFTLQFAKQQLQLAKHQLQLAEQQLQFSEPRDLSAARFLVLRVESRRPEPEPRRVTITDLEIAPRIQGLFDQTLPDRTLPGTLYTPLRPLENPEAGSLAALESLLRDRDLLWTEHDRRRADARGRKNPNGPPLRKDGKYAVPLPYLLVAAPFHALAGPSGVVALHLAFLLGLFGFLTFHTDAKLGARLLFAAGSLVGAAAFGFVFLIAPQIFEAFCLTIPTAWWLRDRLAGARAVAGGVLLAFAALQNPVWSVFAILPIAERLLRRENDPEGRATLRGLGLAMILTTALMISATWWLDVAAQTPRAPSPPVETWTEESVSIRSMARDALRFYTARNGLIFAYPFLLLALLAWVPRAEAEPRRLWLGIVLLLLLAWAAVRGSPSAFGTVELATIAPLFALLPKQAPRARLSAPVVLFALFFTLRLAANAW